MNDKTVGDRQSHWQHVYETREEKQVSWFQDTPSRSFELVTASATDPAAAIIDVGGGASRLVDKLLEAGFRNVTVLDISEVGLAVTRRRLGARAQFVKWIIADVTTWASQENYDVWHDRAVFHFLTSNEDRRAYIDRLVTTLRHGGHAIIGTFSLDGPETCSGLQVVRYSPESLAATLGSMFLLLDSSLERHRTPSGASQSFQFSRFMLR